jgi:predicted porin
MYTCSRSTLAIATATLLGAPAAAQTTSGLQIYGILDMGIEVNDTGAPGPSRNTLANSGNLSATRFGFRGTEDLGGGLKALFNLEMGIHMDTGTPVSLPDEPGSFFARRSVVGMQGSFGEIYLGRDYTPGFWTLVQTDRFRYGLPGTVSTPSQISATRASNGVFYTTPTMAGFTGRLAAGLGLESPTTPKDRGRVYGASIDYRNGDLFLSAATQRRRDLVPGSATATTYFKEGGLGGEYKAGKWVFTAGHWRTDPVTATAGAVDKSKAYWLGAGVAVGVGQVNLQVTRTTVKPVGMAEGHALTYGVSYQHPLSKRTTLYAAYGAVKNDSSTRLPLNTGSQRVGGAIFGADPSALVAGIRHSF